MPGPRWKNINIFPWRQENGKEGQLGTVRFSLSSLSTLPRPRKISRSVLRYSPPEVECKAIHPAYWKACPRPGKSAFPRIFVSDKTMSAIEKRSKGSGVFKPLENWGRGGGTGWESACVCTTLLTSNGRGKTKGDEGRVFEPTCRGFSANAASFVARFSLKVSFQSFAVPEFVARIKHDPIQVSIFCVVYA